MVINSQELLDNQDDALYAEILSSIPDEVYKSTDFTSLDIKLVINGVECDPVLLKTILGNFKSIIEKEAQCLVKLKLEEAYDKAVNLLDIVNNASNNIIKEFNPDFDSYY